MTYMTASTIPATLKYYRRAAVEIGQFDSTFAKVKKRMVRPTFVVDAANPKTNVTAQRWAAGYQGKDGYDEKEVTNDPIDTLEIMHIDYRGRGGRAWKVLIDGAYYVDLKEDVLLEALIKGDGVEQGHLKGPFIWASGSGGLRLTRYNSSFHKKAEKLKELSKIRIKAKDLVIGGIYETPAGQRSVYLGPVVHDYCASNSCTGPLTFTMKGKEQLWYTGDWSHLGTYAYKKGLTWLQTYKSRHMSAKVGEIDITKDPLEAIRDAARVSLAADLDELAKRPKYTGQGSYVYNAITDADRDRARRSIQAYHWKSMTYRRPKQPRPEVPELAEIANLPEIKDKL
jgi:hypothetical protein